MKHSKQWFLLFSLCLGVLLAGLITPTAEAHGRVEVGPYTLVLGWVEEPVIVGERNALLLEIFEGERPITGLEGTLTVEVSYADREFIGNIAPTGTAGIYHVEIFPTIRGQYTVQITGQIEDTAIDETLEPEEVLSPAVLQFPETQPDTFALEEQVTSLEQQVSDLESSLQLARLLGIAGIVLGIIGAGLGAYSLRK